MILAGGGTAAALELTSSTPANAAQAVALNAALTAPGNGCQAGAGGGAGHSGTRGERAGHKDHKGHKGCLRQRLRQIKGMYGEVAYHTSNGTQTLAFERGAVTSVSGHQLTVRSRSGTQWSWTLASNSVIRMYGQIIPASQLPTGTHVFVGGQLDGSSRDARLVVVHQGKAGGGKPGGGKSQRPSGRGSSGRSGSGAGSSGGSGSGAGSSGGSASGAGS